MVILSSFSSAVSLLALAVDQIAQGVEGAEREHATVEILCAAWFKPDLAVDEVDPVPGQGQNLGLSPAVRAAN